MSEHQPLLMRFSGFELDEANARLQHHDQALDLPPRAFSVLCELARRPGQLVTKDALLDAIWGHRHVSESVLKSTISQLRTALDDDAKAPRFIETASRRGYRFIAALEVVADVGPGAPVDVGPTTGSHTPLTPSITGRDATLSRLTAAWGRACAGQRQLCWLAGEAGIGKTTLVEHFAASLGPVVYAHGQCVEQHGTGEPYLPVLEALGMLSRGDPGLTRLLRSVAPTWLLQMPWLCSDDERDQLRRDLAGTGQERMLREFGELLDRYTQDKTLLLVTEDLHWSDFATVYLINHVARRRGTARWMWLTTFRVAEVIAEDHPVRALRHELRLHHLAEEILLDPFSERELASYVSRRLDGAELPDAFLRALHRHTDGLPLFVANVIDDLLAQGALGDRAMQHDATLSFDTLAVPESLAGVVERQIQRLPSEQTALLEAASACGVDFRPTVVAQVIERDGDWVARQCDMLARQQQWLASTQVERAANGELEAHYAFRHALVRRVFHDRMGALARARLHRRAALSLVTAEASGAVVSAAEIAAQFELGQDPDAALPYCVSAAEGALQQFAPADCLRLADRGLALAQRCRSGEPVQELLATLHTLRGASAALVLGVSADETLQSFERAQAAMETRPHHPLRSMALHGLGLGQFLRGETRQARELAERSLAQALQLRDSVLTVAACDLLGQIGKMEGPPGEAIAVLERGIDAAAALDEHTLLSAFVLDPLVNMRAALAITLLLAGCDQRAKIQSDLALARAVALKQPMARMIATWLATLCEIRRGNKDQVAAMAARLRSITDEGALANGEGPSQWFLGLVQAWSGKPREGYAQIDLAYRRYAEVGKLYGAAEVLGYSSEALILAGDWVRAGQQVDEALLLATRLHDHSYRTQLLLLKRRVALANGDSQRATAAAHEALDEARRQRSPWLEVTVLVDVCEGPSTQTEDIEALRSVVESLAESSSAPLINRARALLSRTG
jgi:DNA-binding winged helix-turn-helix (wHTH) protein